jgi:hypothetical protein
MSKVQRHLVMHTFKGKRFDDHGLDLDVLPDLFADKQLLMESAKGLWRRAHPDRERLPKNFEDRLTLKFLLSKQGAWRCLSCASTKAQIRRIFGRPNQRMSWTTPSSG